jgi:YD repeat-containing protein
VWQYVGYNLSAPTYAEALTVVNDTILEQQTMTYNEIGIVIKTDARQRYHDAPASQLGSLRTPSTAPKARITYSASWIDGVGRTIASADYGTNGGAAFTRPATVPTRSDTILVSTTNYNDDGEVFSPIDPQNTETRFEYDAVGRQVIQIENYVSGGTAADQNRTAWTIYTADGLVSRLTASNAVTGNQQTKYDSRGMVSKLTTWDNATVGSGTILNQVQNEYNEFGQQTDSYQAHDGSVNISSTPVVRFNYYHGGGNRIRITGMTYPNGRDLTYDYGVADGTNDACSRIESIINNSDSLNLVAYQYLGTSGFVNAAASQPGINWTLYGTTNDPNTGDIYSGLDRFGRVDNCLWKQSTTTLAQIQYGYDRASNRTWRKDGVLTGYDELYAYDGLYRLNDQKRGTLNGTQTAITSGTFEQQWGLDATGNWKTFKQDNDGNGTWELNQTRTANKANEITGITNSVGAAWATPTYDPAGNMIGIPNPQSLTAEYDAWNRLVSIKDGATTICENVYDARGYRIRKDTYTSGTLTEARH